MDKAIRDHQAWLGYLQPDGLVVSPTALVDSQVLLNRNAAPLQQRFLEYVQELEHNDEVVLAISNFPDFIRGVLGWPSDCLYGGADQKPLPDTLTIPLTGFGETLAPDFAFCDPHVAGDGNPWLLLIQSLPLGTDLDAPVESTLSGWSASPSRRFERLLRETQIPIGLISNATQLRLVYAPHGENAGTLTFPVSAMAEVAGRPILAACEMLLSSYCLLSAPTEARLPALLKHSRDYQDRVSVALAGQVLDALYELLRGFQAANNHTHDALLGEVLKDRPNQIYEGLLTVLMRLVFLLYAEDRDIMPDSELYVRNYALHGLFERLREDNEHFPDTMDHRYGAWAQLIAVFRVVCLGSDHPQVKLPKRMGNLFDPERFPFLEGWPIQHLPLISDGVVFRVLHKLFILEGERLSYRTLDVEQIGSVYETMMGFRLEIATGLSIALKPAKPRGAPVPIDLEQLLAVKPNDRPKWIIKRSDYKLTTSMTNAVKVAQTIDDLLAALERRIARNATPQPLPKGAMLLMPTDERRKIGSHYTPRSFTEPIVAKTLGPVLAQLGEHPTPEDILGLKVCDPAMGSGAFLVEVSRQLADALVAAWAYHGYKPHIPADEDEVLFARRLIAQRCLYGVDKNPMAVDLAKLSLWLATLAREHAFTFLDHALRCGDSLVGLTRDQIRTFHWQPSRAMELIEKDLQARMEQNAAYRRQILSAGDDLPPEAKYQKLKLAEDAIVPIRMAGNLVTAAFFSGDNARKREDQRLIMMQHLEQWMRRANLGAWHAINNALEDLRAGEKGINPFHWPIEFPEVFSVEKSGFDAIVGNPPFAGKNTLINANHEGYLDWLKILHSESHGNADLVAHFFRRAFTLLRDDGCFGLIATNTIGQGDTRFTGLRWICTNGGTIYNARKRVKWPNQAAVIVSIVHIMKGAPAGPFELDSRNVPIITAYLFHDGGHENPAVLKANNGKSFQGSIVLGMGFTFDDTDTKGVANPIALMHELIAKNPRNTERIFPYIGGEEVNDHPRHEHHRYVINFADFPLRRDDLSETWASADEEQRTLWLRTGIVPLDYPNPVAADWPDLLHIVETKVKPVRDTDNREVRKKFWWRFGENTPALFRAITGKEHVLVCSLVSSYLSFAILPSNMVYSNALGVYPNTEFMTFACLQSRIHEQWALFQASSLEERLRYNPSDCFETFPFPANSNNLDVLDEVGRVYYLYRAELMVKINAGLTNIYNRFNDPSEISHDLIRLRELHASMDRAVLNAYGWDDLIPRCQCEFLLDYEDEDSESEDTSRRRKPWRYRWPDEVRDEVLARLLKLNAERAAEERRTGMAAATAEMNSAGPTKLGRKKKKGPVTMSLMDAMKEGERDE